jgi:hypothetical protein
VGRFLDSAGRYRGFEPAAISAYELFPFNSSLLSLSNGVQSLHAAAGDGCVSCRKLGNATTANMSWVVCGRGTLVPAPAIAPWQGRSGHLQLPLLKSEACWIVIGGRNGSHYLNDVWLAQDTGDDTGQTDYVSVNAGWTQLPGDLIRRYMSMITTDVYIEAAAQFRVQDLLAGRIMFQRGEQAEEIKDAPALYLSPSPC